MRLECQTTNSVLSPGSTGRSSIPEVPRLESGSRGVLDAPVPPTPRVRRACKPGHDRGGDVTSHSRGRICPRFEHGSLLMRGSRECRMHAAPAVSRAICAKQERTRAYRFSGGNPAFPAQWLYGLLRALPGDEFLFVTVTGGLRFVLSPVGPTRLRRLDISHGCQNHTTSPYAAPSPPLRSTSRRPRSLRRP